MDLLLVFFINKLLVFCYKLLVFSNNIILLAAFLNFPTKALPPSGLIFTINDHAFLITLCHSPKELKIILTPIPSSDH